MRTRAFVRAIPRSPVSVAFEEAGQPPVYGVVANISEGGACVWTAAQFYVDQKVAVKLSGAGLPQVLEAPAVIAWKGQGPSREPGTRRYGLRWMAGAVGSHARFRQLVGI